MYFYVLLFSFFFFIILFFVFDKINYNLSEIFLFCFFQLQQKTINN